jgi:phosphoserine phosphatase
VPRRDPAAFETAVARVETRDRVRATPTVSDGFRRRPRRQRERLRILADELGGQRVALAVGDSIHDLPMLALAERAAAPANADLGVRRLIAAGGTPGLAVATGTGVR